MQKFLCLLLSVCLLLALPTGTKAESSYKWGDVNNDTAVDAKDALLVLKYAVGKADLNDEAKRVADVTADGAIDAKDALSILKYAVELIERFPADTEGMTEEEIYEMKREQYYAQQDAAYRVNGADFNDSAVTDSGDAAALVENLGDVPADSDIDGYELNSEGGLVYDRVSADAKKQGTVAEDNAVKTGEMTLADGTKFTYRVPTKVTAYDAIPVTYTVQGGSSAQKVHVQGTTYEEPARMPQNTMVYENTLPDGVNFDVTYNGYVTAENNDNSQNPAWSNRIEKDIQGSAYPSYEPSDLIPSGTVPTGKTVWYKFTVKNTGNTILKGDGMGYFCFRPFLYKQNENGSYTEAASIDNYALRLYDPLYPGESVEFFVQFTGSGANLQNGNYKIVLYGELANEQTLPDWAAMYVAGRRVTNSSFTFTAADNATVTVPGGVTTTKVGSIVRNGWLGKYEEFQTSFDTHFYVDTNQPEKDTLYVQPAPWDTTLTLRVISDATGAASMVQIPLTVESDSVSITLNPYNDHYVVKEDGTREPILATQNMADMRGNAQDSPYARETIVNDLRDMEQAGINYITSTMAFSYETGYGNSTYNATRFMMDCASKMGFSLEGYGYYPYEQSNQKSTLVKQFAGSSYKTNNQMNGILCNWIYARFGNMFWSDENGVTPIAQEDSRGWMTIDHDWRMDLTDANVEKFQNWLYEAYGSIGKLNTAWGSSYSSFIEIDPREEGVYEEAFGHYNFTNLMKGVDVFHERGQAIRDLDLFRSANRVADYEESLSVTTVPGAQMIARFESSPLITVGLKADTKNAHYRETYYQMYRAGMVGDILAASDVVYGASTYQNTPYTPAETYELTKYAELNDLSVMNYHMHYREQIYNTRYGDRKAIANMHLSNSEMKVTSINTASALFPALKATYQAGGIPAVMWMDYYCNGFITSTQYKELQFYTSKIEEMLATQEGKAWATDFDAANSNQNKSAHHQWSYPEAYIEQALTTTPTRNKFNLK